MKWQAAAVLLCLLAIISEETAWASPARLGVISGLEHATLRSDGALVVKERIGGTGKIEVQHLIIEGIVAPGDSPGCINFGGNLTFNGAATLLIEIGGNTPCTEYDKITIAGMLTLNNPTLEVVLINGFEPQPGDSFDIIDWGSISGGFGTIDTSAAVLAAPFDWDLSQLYLTGELVALSSGYQIPIPGAALVVLALLFTTLAKRAIYLKT